MKLRSRVIFGTPYGRGKRAKELYHFSKYDAHMFRHSNSYSYSYFDPISNEFIGSRHVVTVSSITITIYMGVIDILGLTT